MRLEFAKAELRSLWESEAFRINGLAPETVTAFRRKVQLLEAASSEMELRNFRSLNLEKLKGDRQGQYSIRLTRKWRLILQFETDDIGRTVLILELCDYH
ncbi:type II toxin-antitoxin system RelE/ParE family toxin [Nocardia salmonicida]|uniref:type II toxin-antitoxin system RelE/ParE family toxin n=1 Tax=Nocardia salmonicida TaxID=53431 RepID=UPI002E29D891|nr:type II toxin-antitoxin system RelE/ParE family toxin [Nocardia salmonicida]